MLVYIKTEFFDAPQAVILYNLMNINSLTVKNIGTKPRLKLDK